MNHLFLFLTFVLLAALMGLSPGPGVIKTPAWKSKLEDLKKPRVHYVRSEIDHSESEIQ